MTKTFTIRQGDVALVQVAALPAGCTLAPDQTRKIILAWGEVTGHHHRIEDHVVQHKATPGAAEEIAEAAIARAKARLWKAPNGETYLEVTAPVTLRHEEHTEHTIPPGIYLQPTQVEYTPAELRRVAD
jgi:hypothetical protein